MNVCACCRRLSGVGLEFDALDVILCNGVGSKVKEIPLNASLPIKDVPRHPHVLRRIALRPLTTVPCCKSNEVISTSVLAFEAISSAVRSSPWLSVKAMSGMLLITTAELLVGPAFCIALPSRLPGLIRHVEMPPKKMKMTGKMSSYRYAALASRATAGRHGNFVTSDKATRIPRRWISSRDQLEQAALEGGPPEEHTAAAGTIGGRAGDAVAMGVGAENPPVSEQSLENGKAYHTCPVIKP